MLLDKEVRELISKEDSSTTESGKVGGRSNCWPVGKTWHSYGISEDCHVEGFLNRG